MSLTAIKEPRPMTANNGVVHGLKNVLANSVPFNEYKRFKEKDRAEMKRLHEHESKLVKVQYVNRKNERLETTYCNWDGDPLLQYCLLSEYEYEIPQGLIDNVKKKKNKKRSGLLDSNSRPLEVDSDVPSEHIFIPVA